MRFPLASVLAVAATTTQALDPIQSTTKRQRRDRSLHFAWENTVTPDARLSFAEFCDQHLTECRGEVKVLNPVDMVMRLADDSGRLSGAFSDLVKSVTTGDLELNDIVNLVVVIFTEVEWQSILGLVSGDSMPTDADGDVDPVHVVEGAMYVMQGMINNSTMTEDENLIGAMAQSFLTEMYKDNAEIVADAHNLDPNDMIVTADNIRNVLIDLVVANMDVVELGLVSVSELLLEQVGTPETVNNVVVAVLRMFVDLMSGILPTLATPGEEARRLLEALDRVDAELKKVVAPVSKGTRGANKETRRRQRQLKKEKRSPAVFESTEQTVAAAQIDLTDIYSMEDLSRLVFDELGIDLNSQDEEALQQAFNGLFGPVDGSFGFGETAGAIPSTTTETTSSRSEPSGALGVFQFSPPPAPTSTEQPVEEEETEEEPMGIFARFDDAQATEGSDPTEQESAVTSSTGVFASDPDFEEGEESESEDAGIADRTSASAGSFGGGLVTPPEEPEETTTGTSSRLVETVTRIQDIVATLRVKTPIRIEHEDHFHEVTPLDESLTLLRAESSRFFGRLREEAVREQGKGLFSPDGVAEDAAILRQFTSLFRIDLVMTAFQGMLDFVRSIIDEEVSARQDEENPGPFGYLSTFVMLASEIVDQVAPDSPISGMMGGLLQVISVLTMFQGVFNFMRDTFPNLFGSLLGPRLQTAVRVIDTEIGEIISRVQGLTRMTDLSEIADTSAELDCRLQLLSCETGLALMG